MVRRLRRKRTWMLLAAVGLLVAVAVGAFLFLGRDDAVDEEAAAEFAQCMRDNGVEDFPDPTGRGVAITRGMKDHPDWDAAYEACSDLIENGFGRISR